MNKQHIPKMPPNSFTDKYKVNNSKREREISYSSISTRPASVFNKTILSHHKYPILSSSPSSSSSSPSYLTSLHLTSPPVSNMDITRAPTVSPYLLGKPIPQKKGERTWSQSNASIVTSRVQKWAKWIQGHVTTLKRHAFNLPYKRRAQTMDNKKRGLHFLIYIHTYTRAQSNPPYHPQFNSQESTLHSAQEVKKAG